MGKYKSVILVFFCLLLMKVVDLASGYFLDPTIAGFIFTPLIIIFCASTVLIVTCLRAVELTVAEHRSSNTLYNSLGCIALVVTYFLPIIPNSSSAAMLRFEQFSQQEYNHLYALIESKVPKDEEGRASIASWGDDYRGFLQELESSHSIFGISEFPLDVYVNEESAHLEWASGLTGGYELVIYKNNLPDAVAHNPDYFIVYDNVVFYYKD